MRSFTEFFNEKCPNEYSKFGRFGVSTWKRMEDERILTEGLITSYPISNVMIMLNNDYKDVITHMQADPIISKKSNVNSSGVSLYVDTNVVDKEFITKLSQRLGVYGYFISLSEKYNDKEFSLFIEPKYPFKLERKYLKDMMCWHITHRKYLNKITKIGLVPRDSETHFSHDGNRIYLFFTNENEQVQGLKHTLGKSKGFSHKEMIPLRIELPEKIDVYIDPSFGDNESFTGGFIFSNIPPTNITYVKSK